MTYDKRQAGQRRNAFLLIVLALLVSGGKSIGASSLREVNKVPITTLNPNETIPSTFLVSPDGRHVSFLKQRGNKYVVAIDNGNSAEYDGIVKDSRLFAPNSRKIAFQALRNGKWLVVVNDVESREYDGLGTSSLMFSPDSLHFVFAAKRDGKWLIVLDGKESDLYDAISGLFFSTDSQHLAAAVQQNQHWSVVIDGHKENDYDGIGDLTFSPDSKKVAYIALQADKYVVVVDGHESENYDGIVARTLVFSPDGQQLAYAAIRAGKSFVVANGTPYKTYEAISAGGLFFSADSKHVAYFAVSNGKWTVVRDGIEGAKYDGLERSDSPFSPNGLHLAYAARRGDQWLAVRDGKESPPFERFNAMLFSPDSEHLVFVVGKDGQNALFEDGVEKSSYPTIVAPSISFSPDGQHLAYLVLSDQKMMVVADGQESPQYDEMLNRSKLSFANNNEISLARIDDTKLIIFGLDISGRPAPLPGDPARLSKMRTDGDIEEELSIELDSLKSHSSDLSCGAMGTISIEQLDRLDERIRYASKCVSTATIEKLPLLQFMAEYNLGEALANSPKGNRSLSIEAAIAHLSNALLVRKQFPLRDSFGAETGAVLGNAYLERTRGVEAINTEYALQILGHALKDSESCGCTPFRIQSSAGLLTALRKRRYGSKQDTRNSSVALIAMMATLPKDDAHGGLDDLSIARELGSLAREFLYSTDMADVDPTLKPMTASQAVSMLTNVVTYLPKEKYPIEWALAKKDLGVAKARKAATSTTANSYGPVDLSDFTDAESILSRDFSAKDWADIEEAMGDSLVGAMALEHYDNALTVFTSLGFPDRFFEVALAEARIRVRLGQWELARHQYEDALSVQDGLLSKFSMVQGREPVVAKLQAANNEYAFVLYRLNASTAAQTLLTRNIGLSMNAALSVDGFAHASSYLEDGDGSAVIQEFRKEEKEFIDAEADFYFQKGEAVQQLETISTSLGQWSLHALQDSRSWADGLAAKSANTLGDDEVAVFVDVTQFGSLLAIETKDRNTLLPLTGVDSQVVDRLVKTFTQITHPPESVTTGVGMPERLIPFEDDLFRSILGPIVAAVRSVNPSARRLRLVLGDDLASLPIAGACSSSGSSRSCILDDFSVSVFAASYAYLDTTRTKASPDGVLSLKLISNDSDAIPFSKSAQSELVNLFAAAKGVTTTMNAGDPDLWTRAAGSSDIVISTHGIADMDDSLQSSVGGNTVTDIIGDGKFRDTKLVFLAACESGNIDAEQATTDYASVANAFTIRGAQAVISTRWQVDDLATALLVSHFYADRLLQTKQNDVTLREAQLWLRSLSRADAVEELKRMRPTKEGSEFDGPLQQFVNGGTKDDKPFSSVFYWGAFIFSGR